MGISASAPQGMLLNYLWVLLALPFMNVINHRLLCIADFFKGGQRAIGPKEVKGGSPRRSPEGIFWSKSWKMARNSPTNTSKGYSRPPESIPMVSDHFHFSRIFGRFEPGSLSTFFQNPTPKNRKSPLPRGSPKVESNDDDAHGKVSEFHCT